MSIKEIVTEYMAICDRCKAEDVTHQKTYHSAVEDFKERGWKITSMTVLCPKCREEVEE